MKIPKQLEQGSTQWLKIDYQTQLITGKSSLQIINILKYQNDLELDQYYKTDCAIYVTDFGKDYIQQVVNKIIPISDIVFRCGHINIHSQVRPGKVFTFLICKVNLGTIGSIKDQDIYKDSIILDNVKNEQFQYNYKLSHHDRYIVKYQVNFRIGNDKQYLQNDYQCLNCHNKRAKIYCNNQKLLLCDQCTKQHHSSKLMQNHQLQKIDKINTLSHCKSHGHKYLLYCLRCEKYLCQICIQKGNSHGNNDHPVNQISQIYKQKHQSNELLPSRQRQKLQSLKRSINSKRQEVEENYKQIKRLIQQSYEKAIKTLNMLCIQKISKLKSDQILLAMTSQRLQWTRIFIKFQQKTLKPIHYFRSQERFEQDISKFKIQNLQSLITVKADLFAEGGYQVGKKQGLNTSRLGYKSGNNTSRMMLPNASEVNNLRRDKSYIQYDANAQFPSKGQLNKILQSTELNFFYITK